MSIMNYNTPWNVVTFKGFDITTIRNCSGIEIASIGGTDLPANEEEREEIKANAKLIAASPELLLVLKFCRDILMSPVSYFDRTTARDAATKAIDKATK